MTIEFKNILRRFLYKIYKFYTKHLHNKFHIYDIQKVEIIKTLPKNATCIDIGTNEGQVFDFMYKHCNLGKLWAVEPIDKFAKYLKGKYPKAKIIHAALSDVIEESVFYYHTNRSAISGLKITELANSKSQISKIDVHTTTLDERFLNSKFTGERLDFIKIDVEGAELNVLKGAYKTIEKYHPIIIFESAKEGLICYGHNVEDLYDYLESFNYKISTMNHYLKFLPAFSKAGFIENFSAGWDYEFIAYQ